MSSTLQLPMIDLHTDAWLSLPNEHTCSRRSMSRQTKQTGLFKQPGSHEAAMICVIRDRFLFPLFVYDRGKKFKKHGIQESAMKISRLKKKTCTGKRVLLTE